jgi:hypothetical protein
VIAAIAYRVDNGGSELQVGADEARHRRIRRTLFVAAGLFLVVIILGFALSAINSSTASSTRGSEETLTPAKETGLRAIFDESDATGLLPYLEVGDAETLSFSIPKYAAASLDHDVELRVLLKDLGFISSAVMARIGNTRALDGTLSAEGREATVYWNYHPDHGLNLVFQRR